MLEIPTDRIEFPGNRWVEVSVYETEGDHMAHMDSLGSLISGLKLGSAMAARAMPGAISSGADEEPEKVSEIELSSSRRVTLKRRIKAWSFDGEINDSNIASLPHFLTDKVMDRIEELDELVEDPEEQKKYLT